MNDTLTEKKSFILAALFNSTDFLSKAMTG
jgi:hypothetical protein